MTAFPLAATLDTAAATPLRQELLARIDSNRPVELDGAAVTRTGLACLQVLASAREAATSRGLRFAIADPSDALIEMAQLARLDATLGLGA